MNKEPYVYNAKVVAVYDGDTITVDIDLGLSTFVKGEKIRLHRINAPEMRGEEKEAGRKSRDYLRDLILNCEVLIQTIKDKKGKYGRYLGEVWYKDETGEYANVNDLLVKKKLAVYKEY
ncbi:MAG: thermonuclease family protein [Ignavibacteria bacterium]|jgi:micrococcal nuclease